MNRAILKVSPQWFAEMLKSAQEGGPRRYDVIENGLPEDVRVISVSTQWIQEVATLFVLLESETFPESKALERPLLDPPVFQISYDETLV